MSKSNQTPKSESLSHKDLKESILVELKTEIRAQISAQLIELKDAMKEITSRLNKHEESLGFLSAKYDSILASIQTTNQVCQANQHNIYLNAERLQAIEDTLDEMDANIDEIQQYLRRNQLEITGVPVTPSENPNKIIAEIASQVGVSIEKNDISVAHRLPDTKKVKDRIIVAFVCQDNHDELYYNRSKMAGKRSNCLSSTQSSSQINKLYINESLTAKRKKLFGKIHNFKKDYGYKHLWTQYGKILLRETDSSKTHAFTSLRQWEEFQDSQY